MKCAILSGSPKPLNSCSEMLAKRLFLEETNVPVIHCSDITKDSKGFELLHSYDTILLTFPLYFDALPSHLLSFLMHWEIERQKHFAKVNLYVLVNCGFFEGRQNIHAIKIVENWCRRANVQFMGGIGIGAGPMLNEIQSMSWEHGPKAPVEKALRSMNKAMLQNTAITNRFVQPAFPRSLYIKMAHHSWNQQLKKNGYDPKAIYPRP